MYETVRSGDVIGVIIDKKMAVIDHNPSACEMPPGDDLPVPFFADEYADVNDIAKGLDQSRACCMWLVRNSFRIRWSCGIRWAASALFDRMK
jgi:hypothetical protein